MYDSVIHTPNDRRKLKRLTAKERQILMLVAMDKTNAEISQELYISERTVEYHISSIIRKLDAKSRVGAVVNAIKNGEIDLNLKTPL